MNKILPRTFLEILRKRQRPAPARAVREYNKIQLKITHDHYKQFETEEVVGNHIVINFLKKR